MSWMCALSFVVAPSAPHSPWTPSTALASFAQGIPIPERPRDPYVFRCVLDGRPRMVTIALSREMWIAYDASTCGMYRAWKGGVQFDGAVYTSVHGPQPTLVGTPYTQGVDGVVWSAEVEEKEVPITMRWLGYELHGKRAHLNYEMILADGRHLGIQETPEFVSSETVLPPDVMAEFELVHGMPGLYRSFAIDAIPDEVTVHLKVRTDGANAKFPYPGNALARERITQEALPDGSVSTRIDSQFIFAADRLRMNLVLFFDPLPDPIPAAEESLDANTKR